MATVNISINTLVDSTVNAYQNYQYPRMSDAQKRQIVPITKYNLCVIGFNVGAVLLVMAAVSTVFFSFYTAAFLIGTGSIMRMASIIGIRNLTVPQVESEDGNADAELLVRAAMHVLGAHGEIPSATILQRVGANPDAEWHADRIIVADHVLFKNTIPVKEN